LNSLTDSDFDGRFVDPAERSPTLLSQLKRDILLREPERRKILPSFDWTGDGSLRVLECPSIRRELEAIAGEIWDLIERDPSLRFQDIGVLLNPRQLEAYQAQLAAVFHETFDVPYNVVDLPLIHESRMVEALDLMLQLPLGKFRRQELLRLITHPALTARFYDVDPDDWLSWCDAVGIVHGADHQDHRSTYIERDLFNWDQGLRRLALGSLMTGRRSGDPNPITIGDQRYLPEEVPQSKLTQAASLGLLVRSLIADARFARNARMSLAEWSDLIGLWMATYLAPSSPQDERVYRRLQHAIQELGRADPGGFGAPISYRIASERARAAVASLRGSRGQHLADGVVVSAFAPMRAIPFRVVFITGLGEGKFPSSDRASHLDLRTARRKAGDVSARERDKYLFLETLLSARDRLVLSYVARDELTGEALQPSSVVIELLEMIERGYLAGARRKLTVEHRLRRYDASYFPELFDQPPSPGAVRAVSVAAQREARSLAIGRSIRKQLQAALPILDPRLLASVLGPEVFAQVERLSGLSSAKPASPAEAADAEVPRVELSIQNLFRFLEAPLQGWARVLLRMRDDEGEADLLAQEDELFQTGAYEATVLLGACFLEALEKGAFKMVQGGLARAPIEEVFNRRAEAFELLGKMPTAMFQEAEREHHLAVLEHWWRALLKVSRKAASGDSPKTRVLRFGRAEEHASIDELLEPIVLELWLNDPPKKVRVELSGRTTPILDSPAGSLMLVRGSASAGARARRESLRAFVDQAVLAAAGRSSAPHEAVILPGDGGEPATFSFGPLSQQEARAWLGEVVSDLLSGTHAYSLPAEAAFEAVEHRVRSISAWIDEQREKVRAQRGSAFKIRWSPGPVPHPEDYPAPPEDAARAMIERRFRPFFEKQGKGRAR
jgi:exodeoxyribonuclease V gamma subunit